MRTAIFLLVIVSLLMILPSAVLAQGYTNFGQQRSSTAQSGVKQNGVNKSPSGQTQFQPYYVDPSRFYYNRPPRMQNARQARYPQRSLNLRTRYYGYPYYMYRYYGGYPGILPPYFYGAPRACVYDYYGRPVYGYRCPPGVSVHVGPFIPY